MYVKTSPEDWSWLHAYSKSKSYEDLPHISLQSRCRFLVNEHLLKTFAYLTFQSFLPWCMCVLFFVCLFCIMETTKGFPACHFNEFFPLCILMGSRKGLVIMQPYHVLY